MWYDTKGLVIHKIKYTDSASIVKIFTSEFGYKSFIVRGVNSKKKKLSPLLQPMTYIAFQSQIRDNRTLHSLKEIRLVKPFPSTLSDFRKSTLILFMAELVYKTMEDDYENKELFILLTDSLNKLNKLDKVANFHLWFMLEMSKTLGFYPENNFNEDYCYFNLVTGEFENKRTDHKTILSKNLSHIIANYLGTIFDEVIEIKTPSKIRYELLISLIQYYKFHIEGMREMKSHEVFKEVFEE